MIYPEYDNKIPFQVVLGCIYRLFVFVENITNESIAIY